MSEVPRPLQACEELRANLDLDDDNVRALLEMMTKEGKSPEEIAQVEADVRAASVRMSDICDRTCKVGGCAMSKFRILANKDPEQLSPTLQEQRELCASADLTRLIARRRMGISLL
jgi:hypothetical protein